MARLVWAAPGRPALPDGGIAVGGCGAPRDSRATLSAGPVWGLIGLMIAVLTRSSALAIGIGIGYLLVVESVIGIIAPDSTVYLPGGTLNALVSGGTSQLAWITALRLTIRYGIIAFSISLVAFRSCDITS
jgi:ABC-2 type transport system permease protein